MTKKTVIYDDNGHKFTVGSDDGAVTCPRCGEEMDWIFANIAVICWRCDGCDEDFAQRTQ